MNDKAYAFKTRMIQIADGLLAGMESEYVFHPKRNWRFDFAWEAQKVAVEVDGGQWQAHGGRHARDSDREKHNAACGLGWRVLHISTQQLENDPFQCMRWVREALNYIDNAAENDVK